MPAWWLIGWWAMPSGLAQDQELSWVLSIDGEPAGTQQLQIRDVGPGMRVLEAWTEVRDLPLEETPPWTKFLPWNWFRAPMEPAPVYQHRLTASVEGQGRPSFHSVVSVEGERQEVQGRETGGVWKVSVTDADGAQDGAVPAERVALTWLDFVDPAAGLQDQADGALSVLDVRTGEVRAGILRGLGKQETQVAGETAWVDGWEWQAGDERWTLYYASGGTLVRFETTLAGRSVRGEVTGGVPRSADDFGVPGIPSIEEIDTVR